MFCKDIHVVTSPVYFLLVVVVKLSDMLCVVVFKYCTTVCIFWSYCFVQQLFYNYLICFLNTLSRNIITTYPFPKAI